MTLQDFKPRNATLADKDPIIELYKAVAATEGGIARTTNEITDAYITSFITKSLSNGIILVIENPEMPKQLVAEIHAYKVEPQVFRHMLTELTIVVHPNFQGQGLGKKIFQAFLNEVQANRPDIVRVELMARESNHRAIELYKKLGFVIEGIFADRIHPDEENYEADIGMAWFNPNSSVK